MMVVLGGRVVGRLRRLSHLLQILRRVEGIVSVTVIHKLFRKLTVHSFAFALAVRAVDAAMDGTFIRFQSGPFKAVEDILLRTFHITVLIGVFNT